MTNANLIDRVVSETGFLTTAHGKVWTKICGESSGVPLIVLHGGPGTPHDYLEPLEKLSSNRKVVFYDQIGCGRSDRPEGMNWTIDVFVEELEAVRATLGAPKVDLIGSSWGAIIAVEYQRKFSERVRSVIFQSPCLDAGVWAKDAEILCAEMGKDWNDIVQKHEAAGTTSSAEYTEAKNQFNARHVCRIDPMPIAIQRTFLGFGAEVYGTMWGPSEFTATGTLKHYSADLNALKCPVLFLCGRYDEATPASVKKFAERVPGSKFQIFENSSHTAPLEETGLFLNAVDKFLGDLE
jgi:proline iminopeptidase